MTDGAGRERLALADYVAGVRAADRAILGRAISLIESKHPDSAACAAALLEALAPHAGQAVRVGVTGVPGAGKSTFIECLGLLLCERGRRVAVLAVDPSSVVSGGSILGDRTRMQQLSRHPRAFIRPSPSGCAAGGVAARTRDSITVCEAAGYDTVLIETVGVGQSEAAVADMCDCFLLLALPGAGDELQGLKRGVLERVDVVAVNKADGAQEAAARRAAAELTLALHMLRGSEGVPVLTCSARTGAGVGAVWDKVEDCLARLRVDGGLAARRGGQDLRWFETIMEEQVRAVLRDAPWFAAAVRAARDEVRAGRLTPAAGASRVVAALRSAVGERDDKRAAGGGDEAGELL